MSRVEKDAYNTKRRGTRTSEVSARVRTTETRRVESQAKHAKHSSMLNVVCAWSFDKGKLSAKVPEAKHSKSVGVGIAASSVSAKQRSSVPSSPRRAVSEKKQPNVAEIWQDAKTVRQEVQDDCWKAGYIAACDEFLRQGPERFHRHALEQKGYHPDVIKRKLLKDFHAPKRPHNH